MLGRLATWLRLIGQDTAYGPHLAGRTLLRLARAEGREILTRNTALMRRADVPALYIESDHFREQLRQVVRHYHIDPFAAAFTRCRRCNALLEPVPRPQAAVRVPPYVAQTAGDFVRCPRCRRIYWPGTHQERMRAELRAMELAC